MWLKNNEPKNFSRLKTLFLPKDYIVYRLTGRLCTEMSDSAGTLMLDVIARNLETGVWSEDADLLPLHHGLLWRAAGATTALIRPSVDGRGRRQYPLIVALHDPNGRIAARGWPLRETASVMI